mgnify:CR=1 FL=1
MMSCDYLLKYTGERPNPSSGRLAGGCRDLWAAVLIRAIRDMTAPTLAVTQPERRSAQAWFESNDRDVGSCWWVLMVLDIEKNTIERLILTFPQ